ncbi:MAG TPA: hypothetical protein K8V32_13910 [Enteractinococcus helveticum]|uniref:Uncharacterized protein n=1 Tax=Enteractinococcus helveticum TaxID=1837282 RepID=A0A921K932_9MICC|nr:hypothetical protein [Enteractinococcus helveticum]HJF15861.1 hypothetical protein [Enteractinococcus helveticum]
MTYPHEVCTIIGGYADITNHAWAGIDPPTDDEVDELRTEIAATIDDHAAA